jgi:CRISPR-associated endoribonuclease Cas2 subtype I-E
LSQLIPAIEDLLAAGGLIVPEAPEEAQPIAIPNLDSSATPVIAGSDDAGGDRRERPTATAGRLAVWLLEVRAGVYVGNYGRRIREMIWAHVCAYIEDGNGVITWTAPPDAGSFFWYHGEKSANSGWFGWFFG